MRTTLDRIKVLKALEDVNSRLTSPKLTPAKRFDLLRRQAELGDQRDELAQRARRAAP
jgi:hypothetical protein